MNNVVFIFLYLFLGTAAYADTSLISSSEPFSSESKLEILGLDEKNEQGVLNGVYYRFWYTDGSGSFGSTSELGDADNWSTGCKKDPMTDKKMCFMKKKDLWIYAHGNGKTIVSVGQDHFPSSSVAVRIDGGAPVTTSAAKDGDFPVETSAKIVEKLKHAKNVTTRHMKWPYKTWVDESMDIIGFNEAYKYIKWAVKHMK